MSAELRLPRADDRLMRPEMPTILTTSARTMSEEERLERLYKELALALGLAKPRDDNAHAR